MADGSSTSAAPPQGHSTALRTLVFKVHNPSACTAATLRRALRAYTDAAAAVLAGAQRDWDLLLQESSVGDRLSGRALEAAPRRRYEASTHPVPLHSSLRYALFADLTRVLCSYDAQHAHWLARRPLTDDPGGRGESTNAAGPEARLLARGRPPAWSTMPRPHVPFAAYRAALDEMTDLSTDIDADTAAPTPGERRSRLATLQRTGSHSLYFNRPDSAARSRNFALLRAP